MQRLIRLFLADYPLLILIFLKNPDEENIKQLIIWLNNNIHQKASLYSSDEMLQSISGEKLNSKYYLEHLVGRFVK